MSGREVAVEIRSLPRQPDFERKQAPKRTDMNSQKVVCSSDLLISDKTSAATTHTDIRTSLINFIYLEMTQICVCVRAV